MRGKSFWSALVAVLGILVAAPLAQAEATRTWVSGVGDDANPCSRTAPCKTFAGAISKTAAGGEIDALDPGGYGAVTITKSITIAGTGTNASILAAGTNGVVVNGANIVVHLRDLMINGAGTGANGVRFALGRSLDITGVVAENFTNAGFDFESPGRIHVTHSALYNNGYGIITTGVSTRVSVDHTSANDSTYAGALAANAGKLSLRESTFAGNHVGVHGTGAGTRLNLVGSLVEGNAFGVVSETSAVVRVADTEVTDNDTGLSADAVSYLLTRGDNTVEDNGYDGTFTGAYGPK